MRTNPFSLGDAPSWLTVEEVSLVRDRLRKAASRHQLLTQQCPQLSGNKALSSLTAFFSAVTVPLAEMIEALYTSSLLRSGETVEEIVRRMAQAVGRRPLPQEVVLSVCSTFVRLPVWSTLALIQLPKATWRLSWHQSTVAIRGAAETETTLPIVILVTDEESGKVLSFRCVQSLPTSGKLGLTLYDALVYPQLEQLSLLFRLHTPTCLLIQGALSAEMTQVAKEWKMDVVVVAQTESVFLRQWEAEFTDRRLDPIQYLRIFDRACERTFGYGPFLRKQRFARWVGWHGQRQFDPAWSVAGLRALFPSFAVQVGEYGTLEWQGWHYRDEEADLLSYWAHETVIIRPSPVTEAVIWVYWNDTILCYATADELRQKDGSYRPYWFPYPRLGE